MSALLAAALIACMDNDARCVINDQGPVGRIYVCDMPIKESVRFGFRGVDGHYIVVIEPACTEA